jgi:hypothetical protein
MKQKKIAIKLLWGDVPEGQTLPERIVRLEEYSESDDPEWFTVLNETEFLEFAELIYVEYCRTRRRNGVRSQPNVGISGNKYFISLQMYSELLPHCLGDHHTQALRRLLSVAGTRDDLLLTKRLCALSANHGYMAMIGLILE